MFSFLSLMLFSLLFSPSLPGVLGGGGGGIGVGKGGGGGGSCGDEVAVAVVAMVTGRYMAVTSMKFLATVALFL